jgi:hypothetical protein
MYENERRRPWTVDLQGIPEQTELRGVLKSALTPPASFGPATMVEVYICEPDPDGTESADGFLPLRITSESIKVAVYDPSLATVAEPSAEQLDPEDPAFNPTYCRVKLMSGVWELSWVGC